MSLKHPLFLAASAALLFAGCAKQAPAPAAPPAMEVGVITVTPRAVTLTRDLPGRTSAVRVAEVRARVSGIVLKRLFTEGGEVKEGQALYQIDPAPYQAALDSARASLARAEANAVSSRLQAERSRQLLEAKAVSQQEYDNATASLKAGDAEIAVAKAAVQVAEINLGYTSVLSPISGRIGRSEVTEGAYVQQAQATLLATVQQIDQLYVDVNQSSSELLQLRQALANGELKRAATDRASVKILLEDGTEYASPGVLQFADITVNASTGSVVIRALFPNPDRTLLPGLFVRTRLEEGVNPAALLVPQQGVTRNQRGDPTAMVVGANNTAELRVLKTDRAIGSDWLVSAGLKAGDRVIVQNLQKIRPGSPLKPVPATLAASPAPAAAH
ncbi:MAG: efflux RND transporter periplasmic adaptor subunit [Verrucomicrobia bacterium]|nr:efflux RND transporter periplasmic adaptor subunit [Verrucomicrobiota bacterium]